MKLTDEAVGVIVANYGQVLITVDDFYHLNEKYVEGLFRVILRPGGTTCVVSNNGASVSAITESNPQGMIYYINFFKKIGCTCTHANVDIYKVHAMYHQPDMEEAHKDPEVVLTVYPKYWTKTLETVHWRISRSRWKTYQLHIEG